VDGLEGDDGLTVASDVPSRLLALLLDGHADVALCPVVDYQSAPAELCVVPVGAIGSDGPTHTVRVFSPEPLDRVERVLVDTDSHTSVALLDIVFTHLHGRRPRLVPLEDPGHPGADAVLLIGDKVVTSAPPESSHPHTLDLGEAWRGITGLPFVFATWMARLGHDLEDLPERLARRRTHNLQHLDELVERVALPRGWERELAASYLGSILSYELGPRERRSMELFWSRCHELGIVERLRPLRLYPL
jgi:chorismate dehydratase